ncbi:hypothetical protein B0H19DRAFT_251054 [Mycena capillaripes]|nr:hypothetical protein B0H19DRAFT_251054 [Mycena capillaripes]
MFSSFVRRVGCSVQESAQEAANRETTVLDVTVDALQKALALENQSQKFGEIMKKLQQLADETFSFTGMLIFPQKANLDLFVQKSIDGFPHFFGPCREDVVLLHHLQRYAACYLAYKSGYFEKRQRLGGRNTYRQTNSLRIKIPPLKSASLKYGPQNTETRAETIASGGENSRRFETVTSGLPDSGQVAIKAFLAECNPPMSHLFDAFQRAHITGEIHLKALASRSEEEIRKYILSSDFTIAQTALEVEALVEAFIQKKCPV